MAAAQSAGGPRGRGGYRYTWRGGRVRQDVLGALDAAFDTASTRAKAEAQARAHVWTGQMQAEVFATAEVRGGRRALVVGSNAPHTVYEVAKGGDHDFLRPTIDSVAPQLAPMLRAEIAARGGR